MEACQHRSISRLHAHFTQVDIALDATESPFLSWTRLVSQIPRSVISGFTMTSQTEDTRACLVCAEDKPESEFPTQLASPLCSHSINTCTECTRNGVVFSAQTAEKEAHDYSRYIISCLECPQTLSLDVAQHYMDNEMFKR